MRYHIRERAWSLREAFIVRDDAGNAVFEIRGKFFHIGDDLVMYDRYSGQELARIKQQVLSLLPHYQIYREGQLWATMHEQFRIFGESFKIDGINGMAFHVNGDLWHWNFNVTDGNGNLLAQIGRQFSLFRDSYAIDVAPGVDGPFIVAMAIVIEMVKEHHENKEHKEGWL